MKIIRIIIKADIVNEMKDKSTQLWSCILNEVNEDELGDLEFLYNTHACTHVRTHTHIHRNRKLVDGRSKVKARG